MSEITVYREQDKTRTFSALDGFEKIHFTLHVLVVKTHPRPVCLRVSGSCLFVLYHVMTPRTTFPSAVNSSSRIAPLIWGYGALNVFLF